MYRHITFCRLLNRKSVIQSNDCTTPPSNNLSKVSKGIFCEYCENATLHGVRYFTESKRHWTEKTWWIVAFHLSVGLCVFSIWNLWSKWDERPVIVSFNDIPSSIRTIPFPAITVCPTNRVNKEMIDYTKLYAVVGSEYITLDAFSQDSLNLINAASEICSLSLELPTNSTKFLRNISRELIYKSIEELTPVGNASVIRKMGNDAPSDMDGMYTEEGHCYTYNMLNSKEIFSDEMAPEMLITKSPNVSNWNHEDGYYSTDRVSDEYPVRGKGGRDVSVLSIFFSTSKTDEDFLCGGPFIGFRIALHSPDELPNMIRDCVPIPTDSTVYVNVKPNVITATQGLEKLSSNQRQCYYRKERQLRFFRTYSQKHCEFECLANYTKEMCGCVQFSMPRDKATPVCTMFEQPCYTDASSMLLSDFVVHKCRCLPTCKSITYGFDISQVQTNYFDVLKLANDKNFLFTNRTFQFSLVSVAFREHEFLALNRSQLYTQTDFVANCGGLLGLFMGISLLSIAELIYYFTLRLFWNIRKTKTQQIADERWSGSTVTYIKDFYRGPKNSRIISVYPR